MIQVVPQYHGRGEDFRINHQGKSVMLTKIAVSCDEHGHLVDVLLALLRKRGYEPIYFGPHAGEEAHDWPLVTQQAIDQVLKGKAEEAIVMCWTEPVAQS